MRQREFISVLAGSAAWPLAARAQQPGKLPTIGFLGTTDRSTMRPWITAFVERLRDLGWIEDRTISIAYRWAEGDSERYAEIAAEFVRLNVNVSSRRDPQLPKQKRRHRSSRRVRRFSAACSAS
jgi:putative ABC transport system substrate-binding protein